MAENQEGDDAFTFTQADLDEVEGTLAERDSDGGSANRSEGMDAEPSRGPSLGLVGSRTPNVVEGVVVETPEEHVPVLPEGPPQPTSETNAPSSSAAKVAKKRGRRPKSDPPPPVIPKRRKDPVADPIRAKQGVSRRMTNVKLLFEEVQTQYPTRFRYFWQAEYTPPKEAMQTVSTWNGGKPLSSSPSKGQYITRTEVAEMIQRAVGVPSTSRAAQMSQLTPTKQLATAAFSSPAKSDGPARKTACLEQTCNYPNATVWIGCDYVMEETGKECTKTWVHAVCHGFPDATKEDVNAMPKHYCPFHVLELFRPNQF